LNQCVASLPAGNLGCLGLPLDRVLFTAATSLCSRWGQHAVRD